MVKPLDSPLRPAARLFFCSFSNDLPDLRLVPLETLPGLELHDPVYGTIRSDWKSAVADAHGNGPMV